jgi:hypothetical protein
MVNNLKEKQMAKKQRLVSICALNDETSDAPIVYHFDTPEARTLFVENADKLLIRGTKEFTVIDTLTARDAATVCGAISAITVGIINEAMSQNDPYELIETYEFYDCGDDLLDIYDDQIASGKRVRGTGRIC